MNERILIVDDHPAICSTMMDILINEGFEVQVARNGKDAINIYNDNEFEFVLLDMQMPDIKGIDAYKEMIKSRKKHANFIIISAFSTPDLEKQASELGCMAFLHKPIRAEEVIKIIRAKSSTSILIHISNERFRNIITTQLERDNYAFEIAANFDETLIRIRQIDYNFLIIDEDSLSDEQERIKSSLKLLKSNTRIISLNEDEPILNMNDQFENNLNLIKFPDQ